MEINFDIDNPKQADFLKICDDYTNEKDKKSKLTLGYIGGKDAGKSFIIAAFVISYALKYKGSVCLVGQSTIPQLEDQAIPDYFEILEKYFLKCSVEEALEKGLIKKWNKQRRNLIFNNNSSIIFRHLNIQTDPNMNVLTGLKISLYHLEEGWDMDWQIYLYCRGITGRKKGYDSNNNPSPSIGILSFNPKTRGWLYNFLKIN